MDDSITVLRKFMSLISSLNCLDTNKGGEPKHPLYIRIDIKPKPYVNYLSEKDSFFRSFKSWYD